MANPHTTENVRGLYDTQSNEVYFDDGKVVRFKGSLLQKLPSQEQVFDQLNRWARYRGHIQEGEVIAVY